MARAACTGITFVRRSRSTTGIRYSHGMGGTQSTHKITAQDRAILEYA